MNEDYSEEDLVANLPSQKDLLHNPDKRNTPQNKVKSNKKFRFVLKYQQQPLNQSQSFRQLRLTKDHYSSYYIGQDAVMQNQSAVSTPAKSSENNHKQMSVFSSEQNIQSQFNAKTNDVSNFGQQTFSSQFFPTLVDLDKKSHISSCNSSAQLEKTSYQPQQQWRQLKRQFSTQIQEQKEKQLLLQLLDQGPEPHIKETVMKRINGQDNPSLSNHYRYQEKINDVSQFVQENISQFQSMLNMSLEKLQTPQRLGIVNNYSIPCKNINIRHYKLGDRRIQTFASGLDSFKEVIEKVNLSNNHISDQGAIILLQKISPKTGCIDLSYNKLSMQACNQMVNVMSSASHSLREINLEGNKLGNAAASIIIQGCLKQGSNIIKLNLSKNQLSEKVCPQIKTLISSSSDLAELYLHWNLLGATGGRLIAEGLLENMYLKVFDISHNKIGQCLESTQIWCQMLERDNKMDLIHLDMSFNDFSYEECKLISQSLQKNHEIYGFHFQGHFGSIDLKGFLKVPETQCKGEDMDDWFVQHRIDGMKTIKSSSYKENCWICGGWQEKTFTWDPEKSGPVDQDPIFIHFSVDDYQPHLMEKNKNTFQFTKVFPPGQKINYFFTALGNQLIANDQSQELARNPQIEIKFADTNIHCILEYLNETYTFLNQQKFSKEYHTQYMCKPREIEVNYLMPKKEKLKIEWTYEQSIFKDWKKDEFDILDKCFTTDWNQSRIERIIRNKDEIPEFKEFLRSKYKDIKDCYKYHSSLAPIGEVWSFSQNVFGDFVQQAQIVDNQNLFLKDSDFQFISSNSQIPSTGGGSANNKNNPARQLIRYQFLEVLVRLCDDKYIKTKKCETYIEAFRQMLCDGLQDALDSVDCEQDWRNKYYWTEPSDICMRYYKPLIDYIYKKYAGTKNNDLVKIKYLNLEEFKAICYTYGFVSDKVTERDLNLAFNLSVMTQVDEINKNRHLQMHVIEFMEALARIADQLCPIPYGYEENIEFWNPDRLQNMDISVKTEALLSQIYAKINDKILKQEFKMPEFSLFKDEIVAILNGKEQPLQGRKAIKKNDLIADQANKKFSRRMSRLSNASSQSRQSISQRKSIITQINIPRQRQNSLEKNKNNNGNATTAGINNNNRMSQFRINNNVKNKTVIIQNSGKFDDSNLSSLKDNDEIDEIIQLRERKRSSGQSIRQDRYSVSNVVQENNKEKEDDNDDGDSINEQN